MPRLLLLLLLLLLLPMLLLSLLSLSLLQVMMMLLRLRGIPTAKAGYVLSARRGSLFRLPARPTCVKDVTKILVHGPNRHISRGNTRVDIGKHLR